MREPKDADIQVVGGGILGVLLALTAAERGFRVVLYRLTDRSRPRADSLRNHAWLQSGLLYARSLPREVVLRMQWSGRALLDKFAMSPPLQRGVFRVPDDMAAAQLLEDAQALRIESRVERIPELQLAQLLGPFHQPGRPCFWVPDTPFPEAAIIGAARDAARAAGATLLDLEHGVEIGKQPGSSGLLIGAEGHYIDSPVTVLAAGAGTSSLLDQLQLACPLQTHQSSLMVVDCAELLQVPLFVDRSTGLSIVRHKPTAALPSGRLVIGNRYRRRLETAEVLFGDERCVKPEDEKSILDLLPIEFQAVARTRACRFTAGYKTEAPASASTILPCETTVEPWWHEFSECPGLIAAVPGKATLALWTAEQVMGLIDSRPAFQRGRTSVARPELQGVRRWTDAVRLHHDPYYDHMNEAPSPPHEGRS